MYTKYYYEMSGAHNKLVEMMNNNSHEWIKPFFVKKNGKFLAGSWKTNCNYLKSDCQTVSYWFLKSHFATRII
jgi:hypothetical protein